VQLPLEPRRGRDDGQTDLHVMFLLLGGLSLVVGALGVANIALVGVMERAAEIGLRRASGATRSHIATEVLFQSAASGIVGASAWIQCRRADRGGCLGVPGLDAGARPTRSPARASRRRRDRSCFRSLPRLACGPARAGRSVPALERYTYAAHDLN